MSVTFEEFAFTNRTGITVSVKLEAPVGTEVGNYSVKGNSERSFDPGVEDVQTVAVKVDDGTHQTEQELGGTGNPYRSYIQTLNAVYNVGSIRGNVRSKY